MLIHLLNLDRSKDRLAEFAAHNRHLTAISRVPAVDGESLNVQSLLQQGSIADGLVAKDFYTIGALGAAFSHISLWQTVIETGQPLTIAEDDAIFHSQFESLAPEVMKKLPPDWDFILWGWNFDLFMSFEMLPGVSYCLAQFDQERLRANIEKFQNQPIDPRAFRLNWGFGIFCYTISPKGARALQEKCLPLRPTTAAFLPATKVQLRAGHFRNVGIDSAMNNAWADLNAFVCFPPLVVSKNEAEKSTIQEPPIGHR
jgi:GR25 family glycosyltransferase involved in LPS biosynthesis